MKKFIPPPLLSLWHFCWALASAIFYLFPSRHLIVIGITGTKGKTTTTEILTAILEKAGYRVALANGLRFKIGQKEEPNFLKMTMPGRGKLQKFLRDATKAGCKYAVIEVTSEGIKQHRHRFIKFKVAAITNLQKEHIEAHGSFERYRAAKGELFRITPDIHVLNADDPNVEFYKKFPAKKKIYFSKTDFEKYRKIQPETLFGEFNLYNIACAAAIAKTLDVPEKIIEKAIAEFEGVRGRMEFIQKEPFLLIIDYAHTPDSLEAAYKAVRSLIPDSSRLICVFGAAGGGRDRWKRPIMGEIAAKFCSEIILTNEDPYDEDPELILSEIKSGIPAEKLKLTHLILDRKEAIRKAIKDAKPKDAVLITGKGAERFMVVKNKKIPWSDAQISKEILKNEIK